MFDWSSIQLVNWLPPSYSDSILLSRSFMERPIAPAPYFAHRSYPNPLDLIERDLVPGAVIELRRPRRLMGSNELCVFDRATILQVRCDTGRRAPWLVRGMAHTSCAA